MRGPLSHAVTLMLGVLLGFAVAHFVRGMERTVAALEETEDRSTSTPVHPARLTGPDLESEGPFELSRVPEERSTSAPTEVMDAVARSLASAPEPRVAHGAGSLRVRVQDPSGQGLGGVTVQAVRDAWTNRPRELRGNRLGEAAPESRSLRDAARSAVESAYQRRSTEWRAVTDADGVARFDQLLEGSYEVEGWLLGHQIDRQRLDVRGELETLFVAMPLVSVPIEVVLPGGEPVARAAIEFDRRGASRRITENVAWNGTDSAVFYRPGRYLVRALSTDSNLASPVQSCVLDGTSPAPSLRFELAPRRGIRGTVRTMGRPIDTFLRVRYRALRPGQVADLSDGNSIDDESLSPGQSSFEFLDLEPGRYALGLGVSWDEFEAIEEVEVQDGIVEVELAFPEASKEYALVARTEGPKGERALAVEYQVRYGEGDEEASANLRSSPRPDGTTSLWLPKSYREWAAQNPRSDSVRLIARSEEFGNQSVAIRPFQERVEVCFSEPAFLEVGVAGVGRSVAAGISVSLVEVDGSSRDWGAWSGSQEFETSGTALFGPCAPGRYQVYLCLGGPEDHSSTIEPTTVVLAPGSNSVTVSLPLLHSLRVALPQGEEGSHVSLERLDGDGSAYARIGANGEASFESLAAGRYRIEYYESDGRVTMDVTVPQPFGRVLFEAQAVDAMRITIADPEGPFAGAGLRTGDLLVAICGVDFQNLSQIQLLVAQAQVSKTVALTVLRGERRFEFEIEGTKLSTYGGFGAELEPTHR